MKKQINQETVLPMMAALVCVILMIVSIFLPYVTAVDEYSELLEAADQKSTISLFDFSEMYLEEEDSTFLKILGIYAGLSVVAALLAFFRKPIGVMIFDILVTAIAAMVHLIFSSDGTLANGYYVFGIGNRLIFVACACLLASAIWLLVAKIHAKKKYVSANK